MPEDLPPELRRIAALVPRDPEPEAPPPDLRARVLAAVEREAGGEAEPGRAPAAAPAARPAPTRPARRRSRLRPRALAPALAGLAAAAAAVVLVAGDGGGLEARGELARGPVGATVELTERGIGRVVTLRSDSLPELPKGEFYELWFATPRDRPTAPDRISAGTWHPDTEGESAVSFTGAVDPARNPVVVITREPADGDPAPSGREVLRGPVRPA